MAPVFLSAVERLTDAQWDFRPAADRWSIGLISEHLGLVERGLFGRAERAIEHEPHPDWPSATGGKDSLIGTMLADRDSRRDAPDPVVPTGTVGRSDALRIFRERRARTLAFAEATTAPLKAHTSDHRVTFACACGPASIGMIRALWIISL
jgi:hypothetical protein